MKKATAQLSASLDIQCPECENEFDLFDVDDDGIYLKPIFNNKWDDLQGETVECPQCYFEFEIDSIEW